MDRRYDLDEMQYASAFSAFQAAVARAPGQVAFANICRCSQGNISQLLRKKSLLPERFVLKASAATGVPAHELRPDIYPAGPSGEHEDSVTPMGVSVVCDQGAVSQERVA